MDEADFQKMIRQTLESRRQLALAMLRAYAAGELEHTPEDIADQQSELDECNAELAELDSGQA